MGTGGEKSIWNDSPLKEAMARMIPFPHSEYQEVYVIRFP